MSASRTLWARDPCCMQWGHSIGANLPARPQSPLSNQRCSRYLEAHTIDAGAGRYKKCLAIRSGPGQIGNALGHENCRQRFSFGRKYPDTAGTCAVDISLLIDLHAIRGAGTWIRSCVVDYLSLSQ